MAIKLPRIFGRQPAAPVVLKPADVIADIAPPTIAVRAGRTADHKLDRNLERIRTLRTSIMAKLLGWRAQPFLDWLEGRPTFDLVVPGLVEGRSKRLARWCDVPTPVLIQAFAALAGYNLRVDGGNRNIAAALDLLVRHAATADGVDFDVRRFIIQHLAELVERQRDLKLEDDAQLLAALQAQHRVRKAHRDVRKEAMRGGQALVPVPNDPRRLMPLKLTAEQQANIAAAFRRRNELLGVR